MSTSVGDIYISLRADVSAFEQDMLKADTRAAKTGATIQQSLGKLSGSTAGLGSVASGFGKLSDAAAGAGQSVQTAAAQTEQVKNGFAQLSQSQQLAAEGFQGATEGSQTFAAGLSQVSGQTAGVQSTARVLESTNESASKTGTEGASALNRFASSLERAAKTVAEFAVAELGLQKLNQYLKESGPAFGASGIAATSWSERLVNAYRVARLAFATRASIAAGSALPVIETGGILAGGLVLEHLAKTTYSEANRSEAQQTEAGLTDQSVESIDAAQLAGHGRNSSEIHSLAVKVEGIDALRDAAERLSSIENPAERAKEAVKLFGDDASTALKVLDKEFVANADRVKDWSLAYSESTRDHLAEFKHDTEELSAPFVQLKDVIHDTLEQSKRELVEFFSYSYSNIRNGLALERTLLEVGTQNPATSALNGLGDVLGAAFRGSGRAPSDGSLFRISADGTSNIPFLGNADEQLRRELSRNVRNNADAQERLHAGSKEFPNAVIPPSVYDLTALNQEDRSLAGLQEKLSRQKAERNKIFSDALEYGPSGKIEFKSFTSENGRQRPLTTIEKANATTSLTSVDRQIRDTQAEIDAEEKRKHDAEEAERNTRTAGQLRSGRLSEIQSRVQASELTLQSAGQIGQGPDAKGAAEAAKTIATLNAELARHSSTLTESEKAEIRLSERTIANNNAETEWRNKLASTEATVKSRIASQDRLTAATGKGAEALRDAALASKLDEQLGESRFDPNFLRTHVSDIARLQQTNAQEYDSSKRVETTVNIQNLRDQVDLERSLTSVQEQGAEAIRLVTLAYRLRDLTARGATQNQIKEEIRLANAQKELASATREARLNDSIQSAQRTLAAQPQGAEAVRQAEQNAKYDDLRKGGASESEIAKTRQLDQLQQQQQITTEALHTGIAYQDQVESINREISTLEQLRRTQGDSLAIEISLKSLREEQTRVLSQQALVLGTARDGMRAFFREMATQGQSAAQQVHDSLAAAFDSLNDGLARIVSGQKVSWASLFQSISADLAKMSIRNLEAQLAAKIFPANQQGAQNQQPVGRIGRIAQSLGLGGNSRRPWDEQPPSGVSTPGIGRIGGRDGQSAGTALFVTMGSLPVSGASAPQSITLPSLPVPSLRPPNLSKLAPEARSTAPGALPTDVLTRLSSGLIRREPKAILTDEDRANLATFANSELGQLEFGGFRAAGGSVDADVAHIVGEEGPELFIPDADGTIVNRQHLKALAAFDDSQSNLKITDQSGPTPNRSWLGILSDAFGGIGQAGASKIPHGKPQLGGNANLTKQDLDALGNFDNSELGQLEHGKHGKTGMSGANWAILGIGAGLGLINMLTHRPKDHHHQAGHAYSIPNWNGAFAKGGEVKGGMTHLVGEKGAELFVPHSDGTIIPNHKLSLMETGGTTREGAKRLSAINPAMPFGGYRATGGDVDPGYSYIVGEQGPELWTPPSGGGSIVPNDELIGGAKRGDTYIDARNSDPAAVEQSVRRGMANSHNAAVRTSFRTYQEYQKRTPGTSK